MNAFRKGLHLTLLLSNLRTTHTASTTPKHQSNDNYNHKCSIYLAQSSIPNSGFGLFTTKPIPASHDIQPYPNAPSVIIPDFYVYGNKEEDWTHVEYIWQPMGMAAYESDNEASSESAPTFGALCNFHTVS